VISNVLEFWGICGYQLDYDKAFNMPEDPSVKNRKTEIVSSTTNVIHDHDHAHCSHSNCQTKSDLEMNSL
jgi:hypothetical protein